MGTTGQWLQTALQGVFNLTPQVTKVQAVMWVLYAVPVVILFLRPARPATPTPQRQPAPAEG
jgi:high-affinity iron transporter